MMVMMAEEREWTREREREISEERERETDGQLKSYKDISEVILLLPFDH